MKDVEIIFVPLEPNTYKKAMERPINGRKSEMPTRAYFNEVNSGMIDELYINNDKLLPRQIAPAFVLQSNPSSFYHTQRTMRARIFALRGRENQVIQLAPDCCIDVVGMYRTDTNTFIAPEFFASYMDADRAFKGLY